MRLAEDDSNVGKTCPFCRSPIKAGTEVVICPECQMPHHSECWQTNGGCTTTFGCRGVANSEVPLPSRSATPPLASRYATPAPPAWMANQAGGPTQDRLAQEIEDKRRRGEVFSRYLDLIFGIPTSRWTVRVHYPSPIEELAGFFLDPLEASFASIGSGKYDYLGRTHIVFCSGADDGTPIEVRRSFRCQKTGYYLGEQFNSCGHETYYLEGALYPALESLKREHDDRLVQGRGSRRDRIVSRLLEEVLGDHQ